MLKYSLFTPVITPLLKAAVLILVAALPLGAVAQEVDPSPAEASGSATAAPHILPVGPPLRVEFITLEEAPTTIRPALTGVIEAQDTLQLGFRQGGKVVSVSVEEGDRVTKGQEIARLDAEQLEQAFNVARAAEASAQAAFDQARQAADRAQALLDRGVGTRAGRDAARQGLSAAEGQLAGAVAQLEQAQRALEDAVMRAPENGLVTMRRVDAGQVVGAAQPVIGLATEGALEAVFQTPDSPLLDEARGATLTLAPIDIDIAPMKATITEIAPLVDARTGSVRLRARIENPPDAVGLLGASVRGSMELESTDAIVLPWTALSSIGKEPAVWVVDGDNRVHLAPIEVARFENGAVVVASGVSAGQTVVGMGSQMLFPGRLVEAATPFAFSANDREDG